jgi:dTDP-4-amino-4,6-dideoxygalactose transaminase
MSESLFPNLPVALPEIGDQEIAAVTRVLKSGWVTQGPEVEAFELEFATYCGVAAAVAVSNCTTALQLTLHALDVGKGDEVITVSHSFIATANAVAHTGATPVFVDISLHDLNIDPGKVEAAITDRTKAILAVHQLGMPCDLAALAKIANRYGIHLLEDAACAIGSEILLDDEWRRIGRPIGTAACFSFHPRKILTTGDGGMICTDDLLFSERLRKLRQHGMSVNDRQRHLAGAIVFESYDEIGFNYRLTDIQAAIGREQLRRLPQLLIRRRELATYYQRCLSRVAELRVPHDRHDTRSNWQSFHIILPRGVEQVRIMTRLLSAGISTRRGVMCAHLESAYANTSCGRNLVNSEFARDHSVILPLFPAMSEADIDRVVEAVEDALRLES